MTQTRAERPHVIAHRGASALAPENTLAAYATAVELGVDYVEMDVRLTSDGVPVCIHDEQVGRTTGGTGAVSAFSLKELQVLDAGSWFYGAGMRSAWQPRQLSVPPLREVLDVVAGHCGLCVELKQPEAYPGMEQRVIHVLEGCGLLESERLRASLIIQSFSPHCLQRFARLAPHLARCQLTLPGFGFPKSSLEQIRAYAHGVGPHASNVTARLVDEAHGLGLFLHPYTINSAQHMRALARIGVDGIVTDNPVALKKVLSEQISS